MKIVVIGGTGLIGSKVVAKLAEHGHQAIAASPASGVDTLTGAGLDAVLIGARVVVDVSNSPSFEDGPASDFFTTGTRNLLTAAQKAGVSHYVALSVVGTDRMLASGCFRAKAAQEENDTRRVLADPRARYFGVLLDDQTLLPASTATVFPTRFAEWLVDNASAPVR